MPEPRRDWFGRYILPHPDTGEEVPWTRATTFAETLEDQYGLTKWKMRLAVLGVTSRPDLLALAQSATAEDKKQLDDLCEQGLTISGSNARSNLGTALHKFTERLDRGEKFYVPPEYQPQLRAYVNLKKQGGVETRPDLIERITVVPELGVAGTSDRLIRLKADGRVYIADLKTGTDLKYSWGKIAIQLAIYAHGHGLWNPKTGVYEEMPAVSQDQALVIHVPAEGDTAPGLHWVDIAQGWEAAQVARQVREWRKNKTLSSEMELAA